MKYSAILIDPPVSFKMYSEKTNSRTAAAQYSLLTWDGLAALGPSIDSVALPDACLFLWVCSPLIPETLRMRFDVPLHRLRKVDQCQVIAV